MRCGWVQAILHPPLRERVGEYSYLVGIALLALAVGATALAAQVSVERMKEMLEEEEEEDYPVASVVGG
jgi:hypothetical protein